MKRGPGRSLLPEIGLAGFDGCIRPCFFDNGEPLVCKTCLLCRKEVMALPQADALVEHLKKQR